MTYELIYKDNVVNGAFFKDDLFGVFLITDIVNKDLDIPDSLSLKCNDNIITTYWDKENTYNVYKYKKEKGYIYIFAKLNSNEFDLKYYTFEDLAIDSKNEIFTSKDVLEYLAFICKLPNGNYVIDNVQNYISAIEDLKRKYPDGETFFRGHYYYKYEMVPSLYRKEKYRDNEDYMYMDFKTQFYNELSNKKYIEILTMMQHYNMPTRLLDTTSNPLVALFMACDKPHGFKSNKYGIGEVIVMSEDRHNIKYSDSNAVTMVSSLAVLETKYKQELYLKFNEAIEKKDKSIYENSMAYKRFKAEVSSELSTFDDTFFSPEVLLKPRHVKVGLINERINAQNGNFIIFGLCNYENGEFRRLNTVIKERVFIVRRNIISNQLEMLNINDGTMYPDKDHISSVITKKY